ncbi:hypothetical protein HJG60_009107 [Phyllostomus discolor]|uniref:Uncharacterized protein n=1 Tax=Phyllostomus discolor TaxID=89673 RepID=A0A833YRX3_9CHIR|nr:hypothetical protein HJG60_009107 [Phyllostomus discolor]
MDSTRSFANQACEPNPCRAPAALPAGCASHSAGLSVAQTPGGVASIPGSGNLPRGCELGDSAPCPPPGESPRARCRGLQGATAWARPPSGAAVHCRRGACWGSRVAGNCLCGYVGRMRGGLSGAPPLRPTTQATPFPVQSHWWSVCGIVRRTSEAESEGPRPFPQSTRFPFSVRTFFSVANQHLTTLPKAAPFILPRITTVKYCRCTVPTLASACSDSTLYVFCMP